MLHKTKHFWYQYQAGKKKIKKVQRAFRPLKAILRLLSHKPESPVNWFDRMIAVVSTPFKRLGVFGWKETGKVARAIGTVVRKAVHSSDGFWTIDVKLSSLTVNGVMKRFGKKTPRFIRIEIEPGTPVHALVSARIPKRGQKIRTTAPVVVDYDGPFLELHPKEDFSIL